MNVHALVRAWASESAGASKGAGCRTASLAQWRSIGELGLYYSNTPPQACESLLVSPTIMARSLSNLVLGSALVRRSAIMSLVDT